MEGHLDAIWAEALFRVYSVSMLNTKCNDQGCYHGILDLFVPRQYISSALMVWTGEYLSVGVLISRLFSHVYILFPNMVGII